MPGLTASWTCVLLMTMAGCRPLSSRIASKHPGLSLLQGHRVEEQPFYIVLFEGLHDFLFAEQRRILDSLEYLSNHGRTEQVT